MYCLTFFISCKNSFRLNTVTFWRHQWADIFSCFAVERMSEEESSIRGASTN